MNFSSAHLEKLGGAFKTAVGLRGKGESTFGMIAESVAEGAITFGMAYANGRYAEPGKTALEVGGMPVDLTAGTLLQVGALIGFFGSYGNAAHIVGKAMATPYLVRQGQMMGVNHRVAKSLPATTPAATRGQFAPGVAGAFGPGQPAMHAPAPQAAVAGIWGGV